jgi:hypothetical protein
MDRATHADDTTLTRILIGVGTAMKIDLSLLIRKNLPNPVTPTFPTPPRRLLPRLAFHDAGLQR